MAATSCEKWLILDYCVSDRQRISAAVTSDAVETVVGGDQ